MIDEILEDKGSEKRYRIRIKKGGGLFSRSVFFDVLVLSQKKIPKESLKDIGDKLISQEDQWEKKEGKKTDWVTVVPGYSGAKFYIKKI